MPATYYAINQTLDFNFGSGSYTPPTSYYLGLSTTTIGASGSTVTEPTDASYARQEIPNSDKSFWTSASDGVITNGSTVTFPQSSDSWGSIICAFLSDALTSGNVWYYDVLDVPITVGPNTEIELPPGIIEIEGF
jgi:hypothetical protein